MSRVIDNALKEVRKTTITFLDNSNIEFKDAYIFWTNFSGKPNKFGKAARTFNIAIPEDAVQPLLDAGYRIREAEAGDGVDANGNPIVLKVFFINVKVNMEGPYPPRVVLYSEFRGKRTQRTLDLETIGELDRMDFQRVDVRVHGYMSSNFPGKCTGYLNTLHAVQEPNIIFDGFYDDWMAEQPDDGSDALPTFQPADKY